MREGRKKEASKVKQTTRQSNTAHPRQSLFLRKMSCWIFFILSFLPVIFPLPTSIFPLPLSVYQSSFSSVWRGIGSELRYNWGPRPLMNNQRLSTHVLSHLPQTCINRLEYVCMYMYVRIYIHLYSYIGIHCHSSSPCLHWNISVTLLILLWTHCMSCWLVAPYIILTSTRVLTCVDTRSNEWKVSGF